jgi:hypothetical protein
MRRNVAFLGTAVVVVSAVVNVAHTASHAGQRLIHPAGHPVLRSGPYGGPGPSPAAHGTGAQRARGPAHRHRGSSRQDGRARSRCAGRVRTGRRRARGEAHRRCGTYLPGGDANAEEVPGVLVARQDSSCHAWRRADVPREQVRPHPLGRVPVQRGRRKPGTSPLIGRRTYDRFGVYPGS